MILGVLFSNKRFIRICRGEIPYQLSFLAQESEEDIKIIAFSPSQIDWLDEYINALVYKVYEGVWKLERSPLPDIIYDRATFPEAEKEVGKLVRERLKEEYYIPSVNTKHYFGKLETYETLYSHPQIKKYLPDTSIYNHPLILDSFLEKYGVIYIKDSGGRLGKNIYRVVKAGDDIYILSYRENKENCYDRISLLDIDKIIRNKLTGKTVIIQQGIPLACLERKPFDIRVLALKDGFGEWEIADKSIRISAQGSLVTNISSGGEVKKFTEVISQVFPSHVQNIQVEIDKLCLEVCRILENKYGNLGELGIDIALDKFNNIWILEVNGKPAKLCVHRSNNSELIHDVYSKLIKYCKFVTEGQDYLNYYS